jgi:hypothetical protein
MKSRTDSAPISLPLVQPGIPACELRWERPIEGDGTGAVEIVCMAAGGKRLAVKGGDVTDILVTCGSCTIPQETARRPCLFLVPIKLERDRKVRDYFICRWFYSLKPEQPATSTDWMCGGCPYWFPRPPLNLLEDYEDATDRMIRYHQDVWAGRLPHKPLVFWSGPWSPPLPWWKRFLKPLVSLWSAWWGLPEPD